MNAHTAADDLIIMETFSIARFSLGNAPIVAAPHILTIVIDAFSVTVYEMVSAHFSTELVFMYAVVSAGPIIIF